MKFVGVVHLNNLATQKSAWFKKKNSAWYKWGFKEHKLHEYINE